MREYLLSQAAIMGLDMSPAQADKLIGYHELIISANGKMNLTRVGDDFAEAVDRNYLDSLTAVKYLKDCASVIDVGSGAGLPGVPLSVMLPQTRFTLMDSLNKRVEFLAEVVGALELNAEALHMRSEDAGRNALYREGFDAAVARAVAPLNILCEWLLPLVKTGGRMLALKGPTAEEEAKEAGFALSELGGEIASIHDAPMPGRDWNHRIVEIIKTKATPDKYPRRAGMAEKRPLKGVKQ
ncbi:MAG: 16S rRNA (guanine(527)-N(7))-methyltransferase RsmG [Clostridiales bacterium]|nr:16S rRNA (guanine(527)-N(7))-methyltransferase RsmG [Clostridiales bacterium]